MEACSPGEVGCLLGAPRSTLPPAQPGVCSGQGRRVSGPWGRGRGPDPSPPEGAWMSTWGQWLGQLVWGAAPTSPLSQGELWGRLPRQRGPRKPRTEAGRVQRCVPRTLHCAQARGSACGCPPELPPHFRSAWWGRTSVPLCLPPAPSPPLLPVEGGWLGGPRGFDLAAGSCPRSRSFVSRPSSVLKSSLVSQLQMWQDSQGWGLRRSTEPGGGHVPASLTPPPPLLGVPTSWSAPSWQGQSCPRPQDHPGSRDGSGPPGSNKICGEPGKGMHGA